MDNFTGSTDPNCCASCPYILSHLPFAFALRPLFNHVLSQGVETLTGSRKEAASPPKPVPGFRKPTTASKANGVTGGAVTPPLPPPREVAGRQISGARFEVSGTEQWRSSGDNDDDNGTFFALIALLTLVFTPRDIVLALFLYDPTFLLV